MQLRLFKLWPWVVLDLFYVKVKFGHKSRLNLVTQAFVWEKVKIINFFLFLETIAALGLKVSWSIQLNELMKLSEYQKSRPSFDLGQRSLRFQIGLYTQVSDSGPWVLLFYFLI